jgi:hypothetical protein
MRPASPHWGWCKTRRTDWTRGACPFPSASARVDHGWLRRLPARVAPTRGEYRGLSRRMRGRHRLGVPPFLFPAQFRRGRETQTAYPSRPCGCSPCARGCAAFLLPILFDPLDSAASQRRDGHPPRRASQTYCPSQSIGRRRDKPTMFWSRNCGKGDRKARAQARRADRSNQMGDCSIGSNS